MPNKEPSYLRQYAAFFIVLVLIAWIAGATGCAVTPPVDHQTLEEIRKQGFEATRKNIAEKQP